ncbi:type I methionyl aminopeptidase [Dongia sp.]|uniref:type I methionyl aminopeptidase n=1 Tax=Dongia sp. TaxID=1977262 RepID=UPI0035AF69AF
MMKLSAQRDMNNRSIPLHDAEGFEGMRRAGRLAAETLDFIGPHVRPGISTAALDKLCETFMRDHGGVPATIGYKGYQHASCISVNHVVTHGIPSDKKVLTDGDILNIDVTPLVDGWHGDSSRMYIAGEASVKARRLCDVTYQSLMAGIAVVKPGNTLGDVGNAIETLARKNRFSVVEDFCGHGVGRVFHDAPQVLHYGKPGTGVVLEPGMIFTIEPMLNAGKADVKILGDGWTTVTRDQSLSAQFEHSVGVTETGVEIFTLSPKDIYWQLAA